ncbi:MAG: D-alanine--poly(phosphoribitol) ligase subunit 1 [Myxococcales bacterium]|nr:D-alanine--poly(phosphoribitol) ligase subunit 1 [Myxococcales bacterium]
MKFLEKFESYAARDPDRLAHVHRGGQITYGELARRSDALAVFLTQILPNDRGPIAVYGHKQSEMLVAFFAALKSGHAYVPVEASLPIERIRRIIESSAARCVVSVAALPSGVEVEHIVLPEELRTIITDADGRRPPAAAHVTAEENVYIMFTSGSTGEPKGVQITGACLSSFLDWATTLFPIPDATRFLNQAPFSFDVSVMDIYVALTNGGTVFSVDKAMLSNPILLLESLQRWKIDVWSSTPSFAELCLKMTRFNTTQLGPIAVFLFCGEVLVPECPRALRERFPQARVINTYGPTEATVAVTSVEIDDTVLSRPGPLPLGRVKPDCQLEIVDETGHRVAEGERGEVIIVGPSVSPGYYRDPDRTDKAFFVTPRGRAYRTGDAGSVVEETLYYFGRIDLQIKLRGQRIELEDIEANLNTLPYVQRAVVLPILKAGRCEALVAVVCGDADQDVDRIKADLGARVPEYMVPRYIEFRADFPLNANGKVDRKRLRALLDASVGVDT